MADSTHDHGLKPEVVQRIALVLARFPEVGQALLYGSRAKGSYRPGSDIDLTLKLSAESKAVRNELLFPVMTALEDLELPYSIDLSLFSSIDNPDLIDHIERVGVEFYNRERFLAAQQSEIRRERRAAEALESEAQLERGLIERLVGLGYERVEITDAKGLRANLKQQLERHNGVTLSEGEFAKVLNHLDKGRVFDRAKILRDRFQLTREDGSSLYLQFLNSEHWCKNEYQVTQQISQQGHYQNRYDVTLLVNGLPLVQIELKRRGMELKEAFNQINRYQRHSFWAEYGLFQYVQLFVISNGVNTKYYANNRKQDFKQTFFWADVENSLITELDRFADQFLEPCHLSKMICKYTVLHESNKVLMVLRPYQYYAVEAMVGQVRQGHNNGYVWHTTGSGKTLTSFKAAQVMMKLPEVHKVVFVVDRADLDYQTTREFNAFSEGSVDGTDNTHTLVQQLAGDHKLIVTTIQKLNTAISRERYLSQLSLLSQKRVVFIFDECHRSQFGETHKRITGFFQQAQLFGFTGTPIFAENATRNEHGKRTTHDLFGECLHRYVITNAISDENVLKFAIEYWGKLKRKGGELVDEAVSSIDTKAFFESPQRIGQVVDWVVANHNRKTHNYEFTAMFCVSSVEALITYYDLFKQKREVGEHDLRVATIFSYGTNEDDAEANGLIGDPDFDLSQDDGAHSHSRDKLESYIDDYNALYKTQFSTQQSKGFYNYYKDIARRVKDREREDANPADRIDILLVVNMYLTGFDAKKLNTLYVDKNLRYHGLIQAFSRTNRTLGEKKSQGNIVCFRNLKKNTDEAIALFSDPGAQEVILMEPYEEYVEQFNAGVVDLLVIAETPDAVNQLISEEDQLIFVQAFRRLIRLMNVLRSFTEFNFNDLELDAQTFEDYKSKYQDLYHRSREEEKVSIIDEVDFELELIQRDEINVAYILGLLEGLRASGEESDEEKGEREKKRNAILDLLGKEGQLRSKRELIERFIQEQMPDIKPDQELTEVFNDYWAEEKQKAVVTLCNKEGIDKEAFYRMMEEHHFTGKTPLRETVFNALERKPKLLERKKIFERVVKELLEIVATFDDGV